MLLHTVLHLRNFFRAFCRASCGAAPAVCRLLFSADFGHGPLLLSLISAHFFPQRERDLPGHSAILLRGVDVAGKGAFSEIDAAGKQVRNTVDLKFAGLVAGAAELEDAAQQRGLTERHQPGDTQLLGLDALPCSALAVLDVCPDWSLSW